MKIPMAYFTDQNKNLYGYKRPWIARAILRKNNEVAGITLPAIKLYYMAIVIKTAETSIKTDIEINRKRMESPGKNPCLYGQLIFDKGGNNIQWGNDSLFNKWYWENWTDMCKKKKKERN